jgi:pilus assembly protein CpaB
MNRNVLMIMGGALVVAIIVAMMVQVKLSPKNGSASATTEILVARKKLLVGEKIKPEDVRWQAWPDSAIYTGVYEKKNESDEKKLKIYDSPLRRNLQSGEPITSASIVEDVKGAANFLAATISPGMRAMAVSVKADTSAGGFVNPGDFVDVILAYSADLPGQLQAAAGTVVNRYAAQTILSNVRVLAVDQVSKEDREAKPAKTVTLEVDREGAETLALAIRMGDISLALRRIGDLDTAKSVVTPLTTDARTTEVMKTVIQMMNQSGGNGGPSNAVRLYNGTAVQNVPVRSIPAGNQEKGGAQ